MVSTELLRYIAAGTIFVTTLIGNIAPMFITAPKWTARLESLAGGVFLGAGLAHLLADSFEDLEKYADVHGEIKYPLPPAIAIATFVLLTFVELFSYSEHDAGAFHQHDHDHDHHHHGNDKLLESQNKYTDDQYEQQEQPKRRTVEFGTTIRNMTMATISLYIIMDIHSVIEGLALGASDKMSSIIAIWCAIVGHKPVEAFALSLILLKDKPTKWFFWLMVLLYSVLTPVGIVAGIFISKERSELALSIIAAFSAGTFLFVGCHEWCEMFEHKHSWPTREKLAHFFAFFIGVLWMLLIAIVEMFGEDDD